jgi:hypothetical protein
MRVLYKRSRKWLGILEMVESGFRLFVPIVLCIRSLDKRLVSNEGNATARRSRMAGLSVEANKKRPIKTGGYY